MTSELDIDNADIRIEAGGGSQFRAGKRKGTKMK
jgi:hypothetical protein